jgi:hypothetical protein
LEYRLRASFTASELWQMTEPIRPTLGITVALGLGIFVGSFWVYFALLTLMDTGAAWWFIAIHIVPGVAILGLVLMARRNPLPYGMAIGVLGLAAVLLFALRKTSWLVLWLGIPMMADGLLFVWSALYYQEKSRNSSR